MTNTEWLRSMSAPNDRNCYNCAHTKVCHMRIELAKQINRFKYLAATPEEVKNTNAELPVAALDAVVAQTCTEFAPSDT
jgi:hypothetical protein